MKTCIYTKPLAPVLPLLDEFGRYLCQPTEYHQSDRLCPKSFYNGALIVGPRDGSTVIVFEDYNFSSDGTKAAGSGLMCSKGHAITFHRFRFHGPFYGVVVGCKEGMGAEVVDESLRTVAINPFFNESPRVVFESCLFEDNCVYCPLVGTDGTATFLNYVFRNCSCGVLVKRGGKAGLIHCAFTEVQSATVELFVSVPKNSR